MFARDGLDVPSRHQKIIRASSVVVAGEEEDMLHSAIGLHFCFRIADVGNLMLAASVIVWLLVQCFFLDRRRLYLKSYGYWGCQFTMKFRNQWHTSQQERKITDMPSMLQHPQTLLP